MLHCRSVGLGSLKVGLSPGSDRIADDSADSGLCQLPTSGKAPLTTPVTIAWVSDRVNELKKDDVGLIAPLGAERPRAHWLLNKSCGTPAAAKTQSREASSCRRRFGRSTSSNWPLHLRNLPATMTVSMPGMMKRRKWLATLPPACFLDGRVPRRDDRIREAVSP